MILDLAAAVGDYRPGIENAPVDMKVGTTRQAIFTAICGVPSALAIGIAVWAAVRHRNPLWALFLVGGAVAMFVEPILDYMGGVWWPLNGWEAFNMLDVNIPWLVPLVYPWLIGGNAYVAYRLLERGLTRRNLWILLGVMAVEDIVLETVGISALNVYHYFGEQPLNPWGLPLWYVACNAPGYIMPGVLIYLFRNRLHGLRGIVSAIAIFPMAYLGSYAFIGFPCWISLNSNWGWTAAQACGILSFVLAYIMIAGVADLVCASEESEADKPAESLWTSIRNVIRDRYRYEFFTGEPLRSASPTSDLSTTTPDDLVTSPVASPPSLGT